MRFAYADPPYPGLAHLYRGHPDFAGEVDHAQLVSLLQRFDAWALSTSARALPDVLALCPAGVRVAAWLRGHRPSQRPRWPLSAWEPVIYMGGREASGLEPRRLDALAHVSRPRTTDPRRVIGAKPSAFAFWMFDLVGARPGDELVDMFPGSGGIGRAWEVYVSRSAQCDAYASREDLADASRQARADASVDVESDD